MTVESSQRIHVKPTPPELFIPHDVCMETRWEHMGKDGYLTPASLFFIRNHSPTPVIDAATWQLRIEGPGVERPLQLTYDEVLRLPSITVTRYLECAGNGRYFMNQKYGREARGRPWKFGSYGVAEWTGVPLREVLERAAIKPTAVDVMPTGLDERRVERPMPVEKALAEDTILAYKMNGDTLPADHGFPVRVVVPGWVAVNSIKWVGSIFVSEEPIYVDRNTVEYVLAGPDYPESPPAKGPMLTTTTLKSGVALEWPARLSPGPQQIRGFAWSPFGTISMLEYSLDEGKSWTEATLVEPNIPAAGCRWEFTWDAKSGEYTIMTRATDSQGNFQPDASAIRWNERGYDYWATVSHPVTVA